VLDHFIVYNKRYLHIPHKNEYNHRAQYLYRFSMLPTVVVTTACSYITPILLHFTFNDIFISYTTLSGCVSFNLVPIYAVFVLVTYSSQPAWYS